MIISIKKSKKYLNSQIKKRPTWGFLIFMHTNCALYQSGDNVMLCNVECLLIFYLGLFTQYCC